jgi:hypothetical protein
MARQESRQSQCGKSMSIRCSKPFSSPRNSPFFCGSLNAKVFQARSLTSNLPSVSPLFFVQRGERQGKHLHHQFAAFTQKLKTLRCQPMVGHASGALKPFDQSNAQQAGRQRAERLIGIEAQFGQPMHGGTGIPVDLAERVPLYEADAHGGEAGAISR